METAFLKEKLKYDRRVQTEVYNEYYRRVYASCLRIISDPHRAEDFMQEAFIHAFQSIDSFRGDASLCSWICRIAINRCLDFLKKRKVDLQFEERYDSHDKESYEMEESYEDFQVEQIKSALKDLPDGCRLIFQLHIFEEMEHREIAERLGIKEGSSRAQYVRAKAKIKEMIQYNG